LNNPSGSLGKSAENGIESLFKRYRSMVSRVCARYERNKEEAEDLVQDVFLKVQQHQHAFRGESEAFTWIYRVTVNHCLDYLRSRKSEIERSLRYMDEVVLRNLGDGEGAVLARITLEKILKDQDEKSRQVLFLYHAEGLTQEEIAQVMELSRSAVAKRLEKSTSTLKKRLEAWNNKPRKIVGGIFRA
jgi:RNA polymerase sigma-70 factor (ECF subfamily)